MLNDLVLFDHNFIYFFLLSAAFLLILSRLKADYKYSDFTFIGIIIGILTALRFPVLLYNKEINVDESQMITQAMTLWKDPVFWQSVDGTTSGPLNSYVLLLGKLLTGHFDYTSGRLVGLILIILTLVTLYKALQAFFDTQSARFSLILTLLFYAYNQTPDFIHYSSEILSVLLLSISLWLLSFIRNGSENRYVAITLGMVLALTPWAKIQTLPVAFILGAYGIYLYSQRSDFRGILSLFSGGVLLSILALGSLAYYQVLDDFFLYYIKGNLVYGHEVSLYKKIFSFVAMLLKVVPFRELFFISGLLVCFSFRSYLTLRKPFILFLVAWGLTTAYVIIKPGMFFHHYLLYFIPFLTFINTYSIQQIRKVYARQTFQYAYVFSLLVLGSSVWKMALTRNTEEVAKAELAYDLPENKVITAVHQYSSPGEGLAIWGWWTGGYVMAQMPQAVAENHSVRCTTDSPLMEDYQKRYLENLQTNQPVVFLDAVGSKYNFPFVHTSALHETVPMIREYIRSQYQFISKIDGVRIYIRKDRFQRIRSRYL